MVSSTATFCDSVRCGASTTNQYTTSTTSGTRTSMILRSRAVIMLHLPVTSAAVVVRPRGGRVLGEGHRGVPLGRKLSVQLPAVAVAAGVAARAGGAAARGGRVLGAADLVELDVGGAGELTQADQRDRDDRLRGRASDDLDPRAAAAPASEPAPEPEADRWRPAAAGGRRSPKRWRTAARRRSGGCARGRASDAPSRCARSPGPLTDWTRCSLILLKFPYELSDAARACARAVSAFALATWSLRVFTPLTVRT